jgi:hypothetical protein
MHNENYVTNNRIKLYESFETYTPGGIQTYSSSQSPFPKADAMPLSHAAIGEPTQTMSNLRRKKYFGFFKFRFLKKKLFQRSTIISEAAVGNAAGC